MAEVSRFLLVRLLQALLVALLVGCLAFAMLLALPGDIAYRIAAGRYGYDQVSVAAAEHVRLQLGLDEPPLLRLMAWLSQLFRGDLGYSLVTNEPVMHEVVSHLANSLGLAVCGLLAAFVIAMLFGVPAAMSPGGRVDRCLQAWVAMTRAMPAFFLGLLLMLVISVQWGWLPVAGNGSWQHLLLPSLTLGVSVSGALALIVKQTLLSVVQSDYYQFALTKGLSPQRVFIRHGLRNSGVILLSYAAMQLLLLIEGVVVVESLFAWPGLGHALVHAIFWRDVPVVQGVVLVLALGFVVMNSMVDWLCCYLDPRTRHRLGRGA
ncbi:ABC transporter permease [Leeia sp. TBRC 13508]|uniref:ABC transporter permease n=1 Tax=Leeia speluncae TaxID=2884804 RepID=A0ABS8D3F2_9NEIS|nr:ABC transporter permease [Leeia speluncae]MCB6182722.1 ABC transporter permease [Leeia speluncae]